MKKKKVKIVARLGHSDCEDCGSFEHGDATLSVKGGATVTVGHDGHLGGGCWDGSEVSLRRIALGLCGLAPFINGELDDGVPLIESGERDSSGSPEWIRAHEAGPWSRLDIELETLEDDEWYPTPVKARWTAGDGSQAEHVFNHGDWKPFWTDLCNSVIDINMSFDARALDSDDLEW